MPPDRGRPAGSLEPGPLERLLERSRRRTPSDLAAAVEAEAARFGAHDAAAHLVDYEQDVLLPMARGQAPLSVAGTVAGRAFTTTTVLHSGADTPGRQHLWLPLLDGTERLGVLAMTFDDGAISDALVATCGWRRSSWRRVADSRSGLSSSQRSGAACKVASSSRRARSQHSAAARSVAPASWRLARICACRS